MSQAFQATESVPILRRAEAPAYLTARTFAGERGSGTVTFDGLFNEESVTMPSWLWEEVKDMNAQLGDRLSASDYLTVLKGEKRLFGQYKTKGEYLSAVSRETSPPEDRINTVQELRQKLGEILANPTSDQVFPRPRFVERNKKGVMFLEHLRYSHDKIPYADESYILGVRPMSLLRESWLWSFWDSRTGTQKTQFVCPTYVPFNIGDGGTRCVFGRKVGKSPVYCLEGESAEAYYSAGDWSRTCDAELYLVAPQELKFQANARFRSEEFGEKPETGSLYRMSSPIPEPVYGSEKTVEPWYTGKDSGIELYHIPVHKNELDFAWGEECTPQADNLLFLDSLSQCSRANKQQGDNAKSVKEKITRLMQPTPRTGREGEELDKIDLGSTMGGYTLFLRYTIHYYEGTDGGGLMFGLLTPNDEILCFPIGEKEPEYGRKWSLLPRTGKLCPYSQCIDLREKIDKTYEETFKTKNPGKPYVTLKLSEGDSPNISGAYYTGDMAPYILTSSVSASGDGKQLELAVGLEYEGIVEFDIIRVNLEDYTYVTDKSRRFPKSALNPKWISNQRIFLKPESDFQYKIIRVEEGGNERIMGDLYVESANSYAIVLPNGHYAGSPGCERFLQYGDGERVIGMRALAPWRNRPAEVPETLGGNADDIAALREVTKRWLREQGFDPENMPPEPRLDSFPVAEVDMPDLFNTSGTARFRVALKATARDIRKVEVRADGVLIPRPFDADINVTAHGEKTVTVEVPLASGQNWIEVTPVDSAGIPGDTSRFRVIYKGQHPSDLYIVALGVSDYENPGMKLPYAAEAAKDIAAAFEKYGTGRKHALVLTDRDVKDKTVMEKVKVFLSAASLEDRVVFYVAGRGIPDDNLNYYYAPASFDPERVAETGISMDELTGCLQGTKARKRLLLLDTCRSGMPGSREGEEKLALSGLQLPHGGRAFQTREMEEKKAVGALSENRKKRYVEDMFSRSNTQRGINIIATEFASESGEQKNGVFTASVISAMRGEGAAQDVDGDGFFSLEELQQEVASAVQQQTGGRQRLCIVSAEGAENMVLVEGVGYHRIKQLMTQKDWSQLPDVIRTSPRNYNDGQSEELVSEAIAENAPVEVIRELLEHGAAPQREYGPALEKFLGSENPEYNAHRLEIAKLFAQSGSIKLEQGSHYRLRGQGDEELAAVLLEKGVTTFGDSYAGERTGASVDHTQAVSTAVQNPPNPIPSHSVGGEDRSDLQPMINRMAALRCKEASSALYQKRLLTLLPMIRDGADVDITLPETKGNTALHYSCAIGSWSITQWLVNHGANVNAMTDKGATPLDCVGSDNGVRISALLKSRGARHAAELGGGVRSIPVTYSVGGEDRSDLQPMINRMAALRCKEASSALYQKRLLTLLPMIRDGADVDITLPETKGNTALHYSCAIGSWSITQWLVNHGANVNAMTDKGATPLDCVGSDNGVRISALLKSRGARHAAELGGGVRSIPVTYSVGGEDRSDLQPMIDRMAALRCREASSALYQKRLLTLLPMIRDGADVDITLPETKGNTALHYSCAIGSWSITQWLVNHGANVNAVTDKGATPLDCVGSDNGVRIRALLKSRGAKRAAELGVSSGGSVSSGRTCLDVAAQNRDAAARNNLGLAYLFGMGKSENYGGAAYRYLLSARQGNASARKHLKRRGITL